ncbi:hypothetical protein MH215_19300 [Paenibacillus sp. ACRSA]|uniref:hypothetical protein n=1 Tax=Paenibacillus sp. ACRSA TaxID=2918211 RepID=UPI001EF68635|nr:hypothetical protein [Paenibacillus sp. ACRSA]MCG7379166.1 hypothetical protein [Paenibacillus sp. ACRSA]
MKIQWAFYDNGNDTEEIYYENLNKKLYESKYQGHLYCISDECDAMIKFTHRQDEVKFFSTWNGQGDLHDIECPYFLHEKGEVERKKILDQIESAPVTDEHILNTILNKSKNLKSKEKRKKENKRNTTKRRVQGEQTSRTEKIDNGEINSLGSSMIRIFSLDSKHMTPDYVNYRKCVFGKIKHVYFNEADGYVYLNLDNAQYRVSIYLPQAFYADPEKTTKSALVTFVNKVKQELLALKELVIICVGMIRFKKGSSQDMNVHIISPSHLLINDMKYYEIITSNSINTNPYNYL